ncbi:expressed unknown protein [Seminavis robusta]|uniref:PDZ domain-containing protein n=1 Tax=Seminavis robusta TaxID=568900 RepID=A0A9N8HLA0_9STRA|nr:expressed unknown protein [Seminavis robusta]|eukprot:Sro668_g184310.1 n/a (581) ;mRNA; f:17326-19068
MAIWLLLLLLVAPSTVLGYCRRDKSCSSFDVSECNGQYGCWAQITSSNCHTTYHNTGGSYYSCSKSCETKYSEDCSILFAEEKCKRKNNCEWKGGGVDASVIGLAILFPILGIIIFGGCFYLCWQNGNCCCKTKNRGEWSTPVKDENEDDVVADMPDDLERVVVEEAVPNHPSCDPNSSAIISEDDIMEEPEDAYAFHAGSGHSTNNSIANDTTAIIKEDYKDPVTGMVTITVHKPTKDTMVGISFQQECGPVISGIKEFGLLQGSNLEVGMRVIKVNGMDCSESAEYCTMLLMSIKGDLSIVAKWDPTSSSLANETSTALIVEDYKDPRTGMVTITMHKPTKDAMVGISFQREHGPVISGINEFGLLQGTNLEVGMRVVAVNGMDCSESAEYCNMLLRNISGDLTIVAKWDDEGRLEKAGYHAAKGTRSTTNMVHPDDGAQEPKLPQPVKSEYFDTRLDGEKDAGTIVLNSKGLAYYGEKKVKVAWSNIQKHLGNAAGRPKALLKITHRIRNKSYQFQMKDREDLDRIRNDIKEHLRIHSSENLGRDSFTSHTADASTTSFLHDSTASFADGNMVDPPV